MPELSADGLRLVLVGMPGVIAAAVLRRLLAAERPPLAVVVPSSSVPHLAPAEARFRRIDPLPSATTSLIALPSSALVDEPGLLELAWSAGVDTYAVSRDSLGDMAEWLSVLRADLAVVACFPWRLPAAALGATTLGFLNLHPSLLPDYRGPTPLFWQFRDGLSDIGVTLHRMDERLDTGDILAQRSLSLPVDASGPQADQLWAVVAADLLLESLPGLTSGVVAGHPQPAGGSYFGYPTEADFELSTEWPARRAFIFMRGTEEWGRPYVVRAGDRVWALSAALDHEPEAQPDWSFQQSGDQVRLRFSPGILTARLMTPGGRRHA